MPAQGAEMTAVGPRHDTQAMNVMAPVLERADAVRSQRRYQEALLLHVRLCEDEPHSAIASHRLGEILMRLGQLREAAVRLNHAAYLYAGQGSVEKAVAMWRTVLALHPSHAEARVMLRALQSRSAA